MTYNRSEFLDLFPDADPYEDIHGDWDFYIRQIPSIIDAAEAKRSLITAAAMGTWPVGTRDLLQGWMLNIQSVLNRIFNVNVDQGSGMSILDVTYYNALFTQVSAESIMQAWVNTTKLKRLMTVLTIDELRREVWNEEVVSYKIAPALASE